MRLSRLLQPLFAVASLTACSIASEPSADNRFFAVNLADRSVYAPILLPGDTVRLLSELCRVDDTGGVSSRDEFCDPTTADYAPDETWETIGNRIGVERATFVVRDTVGSSPGSLSGRALIFASRGAELSGLQSEVFRIRRLFAEGDSVVLRVGQTVRVPLAGEWTNGTIERAGGSLPPIRVRSLRGPGSPFSVSRSANLDPGAVASGRPWIRTDSTRLTGVTAGRDTLQVETTYRVFRIPVRIDP
jgi:hypothetical protein